MNFICQASSAYIQLFDLAWPWLIRIVLTPGVEPKQLDSEENQRAVFVLKPNQPVNVKGFVHVSSAGCPQKVRPVTGGHDKTERGLNTTSTDGEMFKLTWIERRYDTVLFNVCIFDPSPSTIKCLCLLVYKVIIVAFNWFHFWSFYRLLTILVDKISALGILFTGKWQETGFWIFDPNNYMKI